MARTAPKTIVDALKRWQQEGEQLRAGLRHRRDQLVAELSIIEASLANLDDKPAPAAHAPRKMARATAALNDDTSAELLALKPFWVVLKQGTRTIVEQRAAGKTPSEIAAAAGLKAQQVSNRIFVARGRLRAARQAGEKPEEIAASDDEEPDGAAAPEACPPPPPAAGGGRLVARAPSNEIGKQEAPRRAAQLLPATSQKYAPRPARGYAPWAELKPTRQAAVGHAPATDLAQVEDAELEQLDRTPLVRIRRRARVSADGRVRSKTIAPRVLSRDERKLGELLAHPAGIERPVTRADCEEDPGRPCPWVSCPHHLYLDVNVQTGAIKLNFPHLEVWEMAETCSLDVADRGGITLEEVGAITNLTRERIRQIEVRGLDKIKRHAGGELGLPPERATG